MIWTKGNRVASQLDIQRLMSLASTSEKVAKVTTGVMKQCHSAQFIRKMAVDWWKKNLVRLSPVNLKAEIAKLFDNMKR